MLSLASFDLSTFVSSNFIVFSVFCCAVSSSLFVSTLSFLPSSLTSYVKTNFADAKIVEVERDLNRIEIKLSTGMEVFFDKDGKYWAFYEENAYANQGVDSTPIKEGGVYTFKPE